MLKDSNDRVAVLGIFLRNGPALQVEGELVQRGFHPEVVRIPTISEGRYIPFTSEEAMGTGMLSGGVIGTVVGLGAAAGLTPNLFRIAGLPQVFPAAVAVLFILALFGMATGALAGILVPILVRKRFPRTHAIVVVVVTESSRAEEAEAILQSGGAEGYRRITQ